MTKVCSVFQPLPEQNCLCVQYFRALVTFELRCVLALPSGAMFSTVSIVMSESRSLLFYTVVHLDQCCWHARFHRTASLL